MRPGLELSRFALAVNRGDDLAGRTECIEVVLEGIGVAGGCMQEDHRLALAADGSRVVVEEFRGRKPRAGSFRWNTPFQRTSSFESPCESSQCCY